MSDTHSPNANTGSQATAAACAREPDETENVSDPRGQRIAELRRQYQDGSYHVDATEVSKCIVDKHLTK